MKIATIALAAVLLMASFGCTNMSKTQQGAASGGIAGALGGAGIGAIAGGSGTTGAIVGGALGAVAGGIFGNNQE